MKQPKKLTRTQKECLSGHNLNVDEWMFLDETEFYLKIIHKVTSEIEIVDKFKRGNKR